MNTQHRLALLAGTVACSLTLGAPGARAQGGAGQGQGPGQGQGQGQGQGSSPTADPGSIDQAVATVLGFDVTTLATGELEAARQIEVRNPLEQPTTITEIVKEGTRVKAGDVLVRLNAEQIERSISEEALRVDSAKAEVAVAESNLAIRISDNESALRRAQLDVEVAQLELRQWQEGDVKSKRQALDLALERAQRERQRLSERYDRAKSLAAEGFLSTDELKRDELAYLEAEAGLKTAELNKKVYEEIEYGKDLKIKASAVDEAVAALDRVKRTNESQLASRQAELANRRETLRLRDENLTKLRAQLEGATLRAPIDGLVVYSTSLNRDRWGGGEQALDVGRQVTRNQSLIVLPDTSEMVAAVRVHESLAGRIRPGMKATVKVDALGGRALPGEVLSVGVLAESGGWRDPNLREYTVKVKLNYEDAASSLKPSMRAEAELLLDRVPPTLAVPVQAVFTDGLVRFVHVPATGDARRFERVPVRIGRRSDRYMEIGAGLKEGQRVLLRKPEPGELADRDGAWTNDQLAQVGLTRNSEGRVIPVGGAPAGEGGAGRRQRPGGANGGGPNAGGTGGAGPAGGAGAPVAPSAPGASPAAAPGGTPAAPAHGAPAK
jgi:HlyD family secretion protein